MDNIHSADADEAFEALKDRNLEIDEASKKRLLRRIDLNILPLLCTVYGLQYLDKTTLSYASVMGFREDIHLKGSNYQWLASMFYIGYLAAEYPTTRLLQRFPLSKVLSLNIILWGVVLCSHAGTKGFAGAVAARFFLGVLESSVTPGFALFTSQWYTVREQGVRTSIWFCFNGFAGMFGGVVAWGIARTARKQGDSAAIEPWKIVFLYTGVLTILVGILFLWAMPDSPLNARFLKKEDRLLAIERIRKNQQGIGNKHFKWSQFKKTMTDPMVWAFSMYALLANIPNGGLTNFFNQIIAGFGYTPEESLLYGNFGSPVQIIALLVCGYLGDRLGSRILVSISGLAVGVLGMILIVALPITDRYKIGRLLAFYLLSAASTPFVALLSLISSNFAGYTRKTTVAALYLIAYCAGNIIGPQLFRPQDAPRFVPAEIAIIACWGLSGADLVFIWYLFRKRNQQKERERQALNLDELVPNREFMDKTDLENPEFVYVL